MPKTPHQQSAALAARLAFKEALEIHEQRKEVLHKLVEVANLLEEAGYHHRDPAKYQELGLTADQMQTFIMMNKVVQAQKLYDDIQDEVVTEEQAFRHKQHIFGLMSQANIYTLDTQTRLNQQFNIDTMQHLDALMQLASEHMEELDQFMQESSETHKQILESTGLHKVHS
ncbi:MAG: hypothetical protein DHS20C02_02100 [Micavibrio sp.]|nr:MAG: hypothetical protein DHS20C02_02100 [Micavibrio sp.]